jgi:hypothetical protein
MGKDGVLMHKNIIYVLDFRELKNLVLKEMHNVSYVEHPNYHKTIAALRSQYFWP